MNSIYETCSELRPMIGSKIHVVDSGFLTGQENMKLDQQQLHKAAKDEKIVPQIRFYGWKPWAVSIGANQNIESINVEECAKRNIAVVRRPTGGRAVLHANEITYCLVTRIRPSYTIHNYYFAIHQCILKALDSIIGNSAITYQKSQPHFRELYQNTKSGSVACFAASARYELLANGKKIVGSAQRVFENTLLQHGSILLNDGHEKIVDLVTSTSFDEKSQLQKILSTHAITLTELSKFPINYQDCVQPLIHSFTSQ